MAVMRDKIISDLTKGQKKELKSIKLEQELKILECAYAASAQQFKL